MFTLHLFVAIAVLATSTVAVPGHAASAHSTGLANEADYGKASAYDFDRPDPRHGNYQAERYHVPRSAGTQQSLLFSDRIYRGGDGRYYCRRPDGTTGLIGGVIGAGALDGSMAPGDSKTLLQALSGISGALLHQQVNSQSGGNVVCG